MIQITFLGTHLYVTLKEDREGSIVDSEVYIDDNGDYPISDLLSKLFYCRPFFSNSYHSVYDKIIDMAIENRE